MRVAFLGDWPEAVDMVFGEGRRATLAARTELYPDVIGQKDFTRHAEALARVEAVFCTWGMWCPTEAQLDRLPNLRAVFYAAGGADGFAAPFLERGIAVHSSWQANSTSVAEFAFAQIILGLKGYFRHRRELTGPELWRAGTPVPGKAFIGPGAYRETVALLGDGEISRQVRQWLANSDARTMVVATRPESREWSLAEAFRTAFVVSNHLPDLPGNKRCLTRELFLSMRPGATFINTGRGAQVDTDGLVAAAIERSDLSFLLDVTDPEPPPAEHPLYTLPNVQVTAHIAGAWNNEVLRLADLMLEEFERWRDGKATRYTFSQKLPPAS